MNDFVITTDSNSDIPSEYIEKYNLTIIPQYYAFGDEVFGDEKHLSPSEFYKKMREGALPTSMANNPAVIRQRFESLLEQGLDILHIAFSSNLSGSYNNVAVAAGELMEEYPGSRIQVIDSLTVSLGETLLLLRALDLKADGKSIDDITAVLEEEKLHGNVQFTVDDLHHLQRGGRVSKVAAVFGSMINIKPILYVNPEGKLVPLATVRGRKKSLSALVENMKDTLEENYDKSRPVGIIHGDCIQDAEFAASQIREKLGFENIIINDVSPSIGTHAGPGALGLCYYGKVRS
ncbi:DegV family protein [uncultured Robinsoniella sp.]|uniref:DegV family protein n=1 Tax=uncultured Robinsoniella sp. TaxID=904190 RepID=UPI00374F8E61